MSWKKLVFFLVSTSLYALGMYRNFDMLNLGIWLVASLISYMFCFKEDFNSMVKGAREALENVEEKEDE